MEEKNKGGRPLKFETPEILQEKINEYFESCFEYEWKDEIKRDEEGNKIFTDGKLEYQPKKVKVMKTIPTITGLAFALGTSRRTLIDYETEDNKSEYKKEFSHAIKGAKDFIESLVEQGALMNSLNPASAIFNLKNNFDWKEKTEVDNKISGEIKTTTSVEKLNELLK